MKHKLRIGITMGDPSGIGPAVIRGALDRIKGAADLVIIGDKWVFEQTPGARRQAPDVKFVDLANVERKKFSFGKVRAEYGRASLEYLDTALKLIRAGRIDCLVTCPISKEAISLAGFAYAGHTEYLREKTASANAEMMLLNKKFKFSLVTRHIALKDVPSAINRRRLEANFLAAYRGLKELFRIRGPRMAVCGLNPHASDNGIIGREEAAVIMPAVKAFRSGFKADIDGPLPCDTAVRRAGLGEYDCVIAMYHDQALVPLKLSGASSGVNLTLGLPFVRTSPLHGTAFDIAGDARLADPSSLAAAVRTALECGLNLRKN